MGSTSSRLTSPSRGGGDRPNFRLTNLLCGTFFPDDSPPQIRGQPRNVSGLRVDDIPGDVAKSPIASADGQRPSMLLGNATSSHGHVSDGGSSSRGETSSCMKNLSKSKELPSTDTNATSCMSDTHTGVAQDQASIGSLFLESSATTDENILLSAADVNVSTNTHEPQISPETFCLSDAAQDAHGNSSSTSTSSTDYEQLSVEPAQEVGSNGSRIHGPILNGGRRNLVHVDVISISSAFATSNVEDENTSEARQNSRRLFWDAFYRHNSRLNSNRSSIILSSGRGDDFGSHSRWILDFSDNAANFGTESQDASAPLNVRGDTPHEQSNSRSEMWETLLSSITESSENITNLCASGLHPEGSCSCESILMSEVSSARASISRIVLLAEALFEVLDEIHRQPESLSHPAPESIVNSFPTKTYQMPKDMPASSDDADQCHICLSEYEEGEEIRTLPCNHEYHASCVDKWLKDIQGVCPLCRRDVCQGLADSPTSSSQGAL